jgi:hypothetical protein
VNKVKTGKLIKKICESHNMKVLFLFGDDGAHKYRNPDTWLDFDVVLYTETITVGVDFNHQHFDCFIGIYDAPMNPELFV